MQKIFISFSSKDASAARTICDAIEARGYACWIASRDIAPGENFQETIVRAIRSAPLMILVFSANANNSSEIKKEVALASQNRVTVIPVRIEDALPSDAFVYELSTRQWIDVFGNWERAMKELLAHVARAMPQDAEVVAELSKPAAPQAQAPPKGKSGFGGTRLMLAAAVLVLLAAGVFALFVPVPRQQPAMCQSCFSLRLVDDKLPADTRTATGDDWVSVAKPEKGAPDHLWLKTEGKIDGNILSDARAVTSQFGQPMVEFVLTPKAADQLGALTRANIGGHLAILVNGAIVDDPVVQEPLSSNGQIGPLATMAEAQAMVADMTGMK